MINLEQINSLMGKLEFSQNCCAILISLAFPPPLISCERDAVKSFKCKCHFSTGKQMEKLDLESKWIKVFPIHIHNGEKWLKTTGALLTMDWRWSCIPFSLEMKRLRKIWLLSFHSREVAAPENWREPKFFSFNQTGFPPPPTTGSILAEEKPSLGCEQSWQKQSLFSSDPFLIPRESCEARLPLKRVRVSCSVDE